MSVPRRRSGERAHDVHRHVRRPSDFDIDEKLQDTLFKSGRQAAEAFPKGWDFDTYVSTYRSGAVLDIPDLVDGTA